MLDKRTQNMCYCQICLFSVSPVFSFPAACQCHTNGSVSEVCNQETGECHCKENVLGQKCDKCRVSVKFSLLTSLVCVDGLVDFNYFQLYLSFFFNLLFFLSAVLYRQSISHLCFYLNLSCLSHHI